jgi:hypothetical protein
VISFNLLKNLYFYNFQFEIIVELSIYKIFNLGEVIVHMELEPGFQLGSKVLEFEKLESHV